jgi:hypothetical protein
MSLSNLILEKTNQTPGIIFDAEKGTLEFVGRSLPEDAAQFFKPLFSWLDKYIECNPSMTIANFQLDYFNTASAKAIFSILMKLEQMHHTGLKVNVVWLFDADDEDMSDLGQEYKDLFKMPIKLTAK